MSRVKIFTASDSPILSWGTAEVEEQVNKWLQQNEGKVKAISISSPSYKKSSAGDSVSISVFYDEI